MVGARGGHGFVVVAMVGAACGDDALCENGTAADSVWIENQDDLRAMVGCTHVKGHLLIESLPAADLVGLESLTTVDGKLIIGPNDVLDDISALAGLTSVGGGNLQGGSELDISLNPRLTTISLPALTSVPGHLAIGGAGLTSVSFPALTSIGGGLAVLETAALTSLAGLETVTALGGNLVVQDNTALLDTAGLGGLSDVAADILVTENPALTTLDLPALTSVGATGPSPTSIGPSSRQLYVVSNPVLTRIDLPALSFVGPGGVRISNNAALPQCQADAVATRAGKTCECVGNTGAGTCP